MRTPEPESSRSKIPVSYWCCRAYKENGGLPLYFTRLSSLALVSLSFLLHSWRKMHLAKYSRPFLYGCTKLGLNKGYDPTKDSILLYSFNAIFATPNLLNVDLVASGIVNV